MPRVNSKLQCSSKSKFGNREMPRKANGPESTDPYPRRTGFRVSTMLRVAAIQFKTLAERSATLTKVLWIYSSQGFLLSDL